VRRHKDLLETYAPNLRNLRLLQYDDFARNRLTVLQRRGGGPRRLRKDVSNHRSERHRL
jgi:hypothetical protein